MDMSRMSTIGLVSAPAHNTTNANNCEQLADLRARVTASEFVYRARGGFPKYI